MSPCAALLEPLVFIDEPANDSASLPAIVEQVGTPDVCVPDDEAHIWLTANDAELNPLVDVDFLEFEADLSFTALPVSAAAVDAAFSVEVADEAAATPIDLAVFVDAIPIRQPAPVLLPTVPTLLPAAANALPRPPANTPLPLRATSALFGVGGGSEPAVHTAQRPATAVKDEAMDGMGMMEPAAPKDPPQQSAAKHAEPVVRKPDHGDHTEWIESMVKNGPSLETDGLVCYEATPNPARTTDNPRSPKLAALLFCLLLVIGTLQLRMRTGSARNFSWRAAYPRGDQTLSGRRSRAAIELMS